MAITDKSDKEIIEIVEPMIDDVVNASNKKDWSLFSQYQTDEEANDPENRKSVERQWKESRLLTSLNPEREILGVLRREDMALVYWKQTSNKVSGEYLASYHIKEVNKEIKEVGFLIV
ncbi:hypothetical protein SAMN05216571_1221 [Onishia taeanensis]|uniref:Uncharacterized protein n=1 Tax=Onishia taeanensis TaxID=284577 RepID=A0A1G7VFE2_9GAMM|nr:hypothetical protein [Halomonas taeanensis]SDG58464.1 hypothetical protein SAMN05216571_1221 [Halomonas taeanensis]